MAYKCDYCDFYHCYCTAPSPRKQAHACKMAKKRMKHDDKHFVRLISKQSGSAKAFDAFLSAYEKPLK